MTRHVLLLAPVLALCGCITFDGGEHVNGAVSVAAGEPAADASPAHAGADVEVLEPQAAPGEERRESWEKQRETDDFLT